MFTLNSTGLTKSALRTAASPAGAPRRFLHPGRGLLALFLLLGLPLAAQSPGLPRAYPHSAPGAGDADSDSAVDARMEAKRIQTLNVIRQKSMVSDADKLLQLARELNDDAIAGGTTMSAPVRMRKAAEIEKLARNVRDKMTFAIGAPTEPDAPSAEWQR
jgi:hypothetical protein